MRRIHHQEVIISPILPRKRPMAPSTPPQVQITPSLPLQRSLERDLALLPIWRLFGILGRSLGLPSRKNSVFRTSVPLEIQSVILRPIWGCSL